MPLPTADWLAALADMDAALAAARAGLDAYEARWPHPPAAVRAEAPGSVEERLARWDEQLAAAARLAEVLEREFAEQDAAVGRWRAAFTGWRGAIQQPAAQTP